MKPVTAQQLTQTETRACIAAAQRAAVPTEQMRQMAIYRRMQIRDNPKSEADIIMQINAVAAAYGAREKLDKETISAAVEFIRANFAYLAPDEIEKAYQLNAAGALPERAEMYGGRFSIDQLGKVLSNYAIYRRRLMSDFLRELDAIRQEAEEAERKERLKSNFEAAFTEKVLFVKEHGSSWEDVPEFWYQVFKERGALQINKATADEYMQKATAIAEKAAREQNELALLMPLEQRFRAIFQIEPENYAKTVARKMVVFDFLKKNS